MCMMYTNSSLEVVIQCLDCSVVSHTSDSLHLLGTYRFWGCSRNGRPGQGKGRETWVCDHLKEEESLMFCFKVSKIFANQMG